MNAEPNRRYGAEPPGMIDLDAWWEFTPAMFRYLERMAKYFANQAAIGVQRIDDRNFRVWKFEVRGGQWIFTEITELGPTITTDR